MAEAICIEKLTNVEFNMEDDNVLAIRVKLDESHGETGGGNERVATTHGLRTVMAGDKRLKVGLNVVGM